MATGMAPAMAAPPPGSGLTPPAGLRAPPGLAMPGLRPPVVHAPLGSPAPPPPLLPLAATLAQFDGWGLSPAHSHSQSHSQSWHLGSRTPMGGGGTPRMSPARALSAPRGAMGPPMSVLTAPPPPVAMAFAHPGMLPLPGIWMPSLGQLLQDGAEAKLRRWLDTIPIGNGADRGWDDAQILEIAEFAQDQQLEHLAAEDIYKRYVEHQVECATTT